MCFCYNKEHNHTNLHFKKYHHPIYINIKGENEQKIIVACILCKKEIPYDDNPKLQNLINIIQNLLKEKNEEKKKEINNEFNEEFEKGYNLLKLEGKNGILNYTNTSYLNSIIQVIFSLEVFNLRYLNPDHINDCYKEDPRKCLSCLMNKMMEGLYTYKYIKGINTDSFRAFFGNNFPKLLENEEQDCFEFLKIILKIFKKNDTYINLYESFEFQIENRYECNSCNYVKYEIEKKWYLEYILKNNEKYSINDYFNEFLKPEMVNKTCSHCYSDSFFTFSKKLLNYPKIFIFVLNRFEDSNNKIKNDFKIPIKDFDLKNLNENHSKENENIIFESGEIEEVEMEFDNDNLMYLIQCGIPELGAKWALYKNYNNPEIAIEWYCENSEKEEYKQPLPKIKVKSNRNEDNDDNDNLYKNEVKTLMGMGFSKGKVISALKLKNGVLDDALELLINNYDSIKVDDSYKKNIKFNYENQYNKYGIEESKLLNKNNGSLYDLYACIYHLGNDQKKCHYVCNIKDNNIWGYYNDLNVTVMENPPFEKASIYFFKNKTK